VAPLLIVLDKWLLGSVAQEDDVRFIVAPRDEELFSVGRPTESVDLLAREMRNLPAGFALQGMQPQVVLVLLPGDRVDHGIAVRSELRRSRFADYPLWIQIKHLKGSAGRTGLQDPEYISVVTPA